MTADRLTGEDMGAAGRDREKRAPGGSFFVRCRMARNGDRKALKRLFSGLSGQLCPIYAHGRRAMQRQKARAGLSDAGKEVRWRDTELRILRKPGV